MTDRKIGAASEREIGPERRRTRLLVARLWILSGIIVVIGFVLRPLGSFLHRPDIRVAGIAVIAFGLLLAVAGWIGEKIMHEKSRD